MSTKSSRSPTAAAAASMTMTNDNNEGAPSPLKGDEKKKAPKKKATKKKKDPNAPKGALSAFMYFSKAKRPEIKEDNPEASFGELVSIYISLITCLMLYCFCPHLYIDTPKYNS